MRDELLRTLVPEVLGILVRRTGDFDGAEDAVQDALLAALQQWPAEGVPDNPRGWLVQAAARRMTDLIRSEVARRRREDEVFREPSPGDAVASLGPGAAALGPEDVALVEHEVLHVGTAAG